ncbi:cytochrome C oxidase subunit IV family protein [Thiolapillus sp.]
MTNKKRLNLSWIFLMVLTLSGALMGEYAHPGFWITLSIAFITAIKGRLIIDEFMQLGDASPAIRRTVRLFGLLVPSLIILTWMFGPELARWISLATF